MSLGFCRRYESERDSARVLIVDADRSATAALAGLLGDLGCAVSYAFDSRLAVLYAKKFKPHAVLLDLGTTRVTSAFRDATGLSCALIALSIGDAARTPGFDRSLAKPVERLELEAALRPFVPLPYQADDDATRPMLLATTTRT